MDIWHAGKRSQVMALIRSRGNASTELAVVSAFQRNKVLRRILWLWPIVFKAAVA